MPKRNINHSKGKQLYLNKSFLRGMLHTSSEMNEGYVKTLSNFDVSPTGDSLIPRRSALCYKTSVTSNDYTYPIKFNQSVNEQHYIKFTNTINESEFISKDEGDTLSNSEMPSSFGVNIWSRNINSLYTNETPLENTSSLLTCEGSSTSLAVEDGVDLDINYYNNDDATGFTFNITFPDNTQKVYYTYVSDNYKILIPNTTANQNAYQFISVTNLPSTFDIRDGDSIGINNVYYRLACINCPETYYEWHDYGKVLLTALMNCAYNMSISTSTTVYYRNLDQSRAVKDSYGRQIVALYILKNDYFIDIGKLMVLCGLANVGYVEENIPDTDYIDEITRIQNAYTLNIRSETDIDPYYNYSRNRIDHDSDYYIQAVKVQSNSYPSYKVINSIDKVSYVYDSYLDAVGFIGRLINNSTNEILYKGIMYIKAKTSKYIVNNVINYDGINFYLYLPENTVNNTTNFNGKYVNAADGATDGYNLLDNDLIHIENTSKTYDPFACLGLIVTNADVTNKVSIVTQAIRGSSLKINTITNLGYFYYDYLTNTEDYKYNLKFNLDETQLRKYSKTNDENIISCEYGEGTNYNTFDFKYYNYFLSGYNVTAKTWLESNITISASELEYDSITKSFDTSGMDSDVLTALSQYSSNTIVFKKSITVDETTKDYWFQVTNYYRDTGTIYSIDITYKYAKIIKYNDTVKCISPMTITNFNNRLTLSNLSVIKENDDKTHSLSLNSASLTDLSGTVSVYGKKLNNTSTDEDIFDFGVILKQYSSEATDNAIETNVNGYSVTFTQQIITYRMYVFHNINNLKKKLQYDSSLEEYKLVTRSYTSNVYFFTKFEYSYDDTWNLIEESSSPKYQLNSSTNIVSMCDEDDTDDCLWSPSIYGNVSIRYVIKPMIKGSTNNSSWLNDLYIHNELSDITSIMPTFIISTSQEELSKEDVIENIDFKNATRVGVFNRQTFLYGPYTKSNFIQFSKFEKEFYFPFPFSNIEFDEPIIYVYNYNDDLVVFTKYNIYLLTGSSSITECTKHKIYSNLSILETDVGLVQTIGKYLMFFNNNMGYLMTPNIYTDDPTDIKVYKLTEYIKELEDDPTEYLCKYDTGFNSTNKLYNINPTSYIQNNNIYLVYNYKLNDTDNNLHLHTIIYIYNIDYKYWKLYESKYLYNVISAYICEPYLNNQFVINDNSNQLNILVFDISYKYGNKDIKFDSSGIYTDSDNYIKSYIDSGYLSVDTMNDKRFKDLIYEFDNIRDTITLKCNFCVDNIPMLVNDTNAYITKQKTLVNTEDIVELETKNSFSATDLNVSSPVYPMYNAIFKIGTQGYVVGNRTHVRIPIFGKGRLPSFQIEITSSKPYEFINYSIIYKEKDLNRRR